MSSYEAKVRIIGDNKIKLEIVKGGLSGIGDKGDLIELKKQQFKKALVF